MSKWELTVLDICLSDYFRGHPKPVLAIPVHKGMGTEEFVDAVVYEYNLTWDYLTYNELWPELHDAEIRKIAYDLVNGDVEDLFPDLEEPTDEDDVESVYCYIAIARR